MKCIDLQQERELASTIREWPLVTTSLIKHMDTSQLPLTVPVHTNYTLQDRPHTGQHLGAITTTTNCFKLQGNIKGSKQQEGNSIYRDSLSGQILQK